MGTPEGKGLYLTVYPLSRPNTDTGYKVQLPQITFILFYRTSIFLRYKKLFKYKK